MNLYFHYATCGNGPFINQAIDTILPEKMINVVNATMIDVLPEAPRTFQLTYMYFPKYPRLLLVYVFMFQNMLQINGMLDTKYLKYSG